MDLTQALGIAVVSGLSPLISKYLMDPMVRMMDRCLPQGIVKRILLFKIGR